MTSNNSGMSMYMMNCVDIAMSGNTEDPITFEQLNILKDSQHPRGSISICRDNNKPYFYNVETIIKILDRHKGNVNVVYAKASSKAALNEVNEAFDLLNVAIKHLKTIKLWARKEKVFQKFYEDPEFQRMVK